MKIVWLIGSIAGNDLPTEWYLEGIKASDHTKFFSQRVRVKRGQFEIYKMLIYRRPEVASDIIFAQIEEDIEMNDCAYFGDSGRRFVSLLVLPIHIVEPEKNITYQTENNPILQIIS